MLSCCFSKEKGKFRSKHATDTEAEPMRINKHLGVLGVKKLTLIACDEFQIDGAAIFRSGSDQTIFGLLF